MTALDETQATAAAVPAAPSCRIVYRDAEGRITFDLPRERLPEALANPEGTLWLDVEDPAGACVPEIETLFREVFDFHPLAIEDALQDRNVPKLDDWDRYLYLVFHAIEFDPAADDLRLHELDAFLGRNFLVTYRTEPLPVVDRVWRLVSRDAENRLRRRPDHLLYQLLDHGVADHLAALEHLDDAIDEVQDEVFHRPNPATLHRVIHLKRVVSRLHRAIAPQREVLARLSRESYSQIGERDRVYYRDVYDGLVRIRDMTEGVRDLAASALETYLTVTSNRTNEIMKTLTIVTVLFLPLNFVVGFFGMNFFGDNIVLDEPWSFHTLLFALGCSLMFGAASSIWFWGRRGGWFGA